MATRPPRSRRVCEPGKQTTFSWVNSLAQQQQARRTKRCLQIWLPRPQVAAGNACMGRTARPERRECKFWAVLNASVGHCQFLTWAFAARGLNHALKTTQNSEDHVKIGPQKLQNRPELRGSRKRSAQPCQKPPRTSNLHDTTGLRCRQLRRLAPATLCCRRCAVCAACAAGGAPLLTVALNRGNIGRRRACQLLR